VANEPGREARHEAWHGTAEYSHEYFRLEGIIMSENQLRRLAAKHGLRLWKVSERSRWFYDCGPWSVIDAQTSAIVDKGLHIEDLPEAIERF